MFTIGYRDSVAIVDAASRRRYGKLSATELLRKGLFKPALCAAEYDDGDEASKAAVLEAYNASARAVVADVAELQTQFGVYAIPESVTGVERV